MGHLWPNSYLCRCSWHSRRRSLRSLLADCGRSEPSFLVWLRYQILWQHIKVIHTSHGPKQQPASHPSFDQLYDIWIDTLLRSWSHSKSWQHLPYSKPRLCVWRHLMHERQQKLNLTPRISRLHRFRWNPGIKRRRSDSSLVVQTWAINGSKNIKRLERALFSADF